MGQNRARLAGGRLFGLHHELDRRGKTETAAYNVINYGGMLADEGRTSSYDRALRANVRPGAVVLDLGAGHGTMAFLALRAGAAKVYAIEPGEVIELGRQLAADNGFSNSIEFIQAMSTDVDLPEQVDGIVTDLRGRSPLYLKSIVSILDARDRFLKPEGWIIPASDTIWAAPASSTTIHDKFIAIWDNEYQLNFDRARLQAANTPGGVRLRPEDLLAAPQCFAVLDYKHLKDVSAALEMRWIINRAARAHGLCTWFDCEAAPGMGFSNSPLSGEQHVYKQLFFPWPEAVDLAAGDQVEVRLGADFVASDYLWSWRTRIVSGERLKSEFRQSTFNGVPVSRDRLRKRGSRFVPDLNEDSRIDRLVLDLVDQRLPLDEIAKALLAKYPARFKNWNAAMVRAADLSERYSK